MFPRADVAVGNLTRRAISRVENRNSYSYVEPECDAEFQRTGRLAVICEAPSAAGGGAAVAALVAQYMSDRSGNPAAALSTAMWRALDELRCDAFENPDAAGAPAGCVAVAIRDETALVSCLGTARCYLLRHRRLAVAGGGREPGVTMNAVPLEEGDVVCLATGSLEETITLEELRQVCLIHAEEPMAAARWLLDLATARGTRDDVTIQIIRIRSVKRFGRLMLAPPSSAEIRVARRISGARPAATAAEPAHAPRRRGAKVLVAGVVLALLLGALVAGAFQTARAAPVSHGAMGGQP
jgi:hypothetical protein